MDMVVELQMDDINNTYEAALAACDQKTKREIVACESILVKSKKHIGKAGARELLVKLGVFLARNMPQAEGHDE